MPEVDKELAKSLQEAKKKPRNFAIIAKGPNVLKLLVSKRPIKDGELLKAKKECQGNAICRGVCHGEGAELVFQVTEDQPSVAEPKFKMFLKDETGLALKPRFEIVADVAEINDETDEAGPAPPEPATPAPSEEVPPPPPPPTPDSALGQQVLATLNKLTPAIKTAVAAHPDRKLDLLRPVQAIQQDLKNSAAEAAKAKLVELARLVKELSTAGPVTGPAPDVKQPETKGQGKPFSFVALQKARLSWDGVRKRVQSELQLLEQTILAAVKAHNEDEGAEEEYDDGDLAGGIQQLHAMLEKLDTGLFDKLDDALNAQGEQREAFQQQAAGLVKEYKAFLEADPLLAAIDGNGFTKSAIRQTVVEALDGLAASL